MVAVSAIVILVVVAPVTTVAPMIWILDIVWIGLAFVYTKNVANSGYLCLTEIWTKKTEFWLHIGILNGRKNLLLAELHSTANTELKKLFHMLLVIVFPAFETPTFDPKSKSLSTKPHPEYS